MLSGRYSLLILPCRILGSRLGFPLDTDGSATAVDQFHRRAVGFHCEKGHNAEAFHRPRLRGECRIYLWAGALHAKP